MILITGGTGFIGSHLIDKLISNTHMRVIDNLSTSSIENIKHHIQNNKIEFFNKNILDLDSSLLRDTTEVYHLAAFPDVKTSAEMTQNVFTDNVMGTFKLLEACRINDIERFVFASTSAVYGMAPVPTLEECPLNAISNYAATKIAGESIIRSYSETYGFKSVIFRFANIFGPRSSRGVVYDFFCKLKKNPKMLEILGNGKQNKAYLYIEDCLEAILLSVKNSKNTCEVYNVGSEKQITVDDIASVVISEMGLNDVERYYTGGKAGWIGDVPTMLLDVTKLKKLGWQVASQDYLAERAVATLQKDSRTMSVEFTGAAGQVRAIIKVGPK